MKKKHELREKEREGKLTIPMGKRQLKLRRKDEAQHLKTHNTQYQKHNPIGKNTLIFC
jgi:hypothetical protein